MVLQWLLHSFTVHFYPIIGQGAEGEGLSSAGLRGRKPRPHAGGAGGRGFPVSTHRQRFLFFRARYKSNFVGHACQWWLVLVARIGIISGLQNSAALFRGRGPSLPALHPKDGDFA